MEVKITIDGESHVNVKEANKRVDICQICSLAQNCLTGQSLLCEVFDLEENEYFKKEKTDNQKRLDAYTEDEYHNLEPEE